MKVILIAVTALNGKLTQGDNPDIYNWTSKEDSGLFFKLIDQSSLIVMGSGTYAAIKGKIKQKSKTLRVVLTSTPEKYKLEEIPGQLEFSSESPVQLISRLNDHSEMLLAGGSKVYSSFMKAGLVDEIYLTLEPRIFGKGKPLFSESDFDANLHLESMEQLNKTGTILLKYNIVK